MSAFLWLHVLGGMALFTHCPRRLLSDACILAIGLSVMFVSDPLSAQQDAPADETVIRALIADYDARKPVTRAPDVVFGSGATTRPSVGLEKVPEKPGRDAISNRVPGTQRSKTTAVRLEV